VDYHLDGPFANRYSSLTLEAICSDVEYRNRKVLSALFDIKADDMGVLDSGLWV
jgi:hypothetical protein